MNDVFSQIRVETSLASSMPAPRHRFEHLLTLPSRSSRDSVHAVARSLADEVGVQILNRAAR